MNPNDLLHTTVTNDNRQHLERLNMFQNKKTFTMERFIASLQAGEEVTKVFHRGERNDLRISSMTWMSARLIERLEEEFDVYANACAEGMP